MFFNLRLNCSFFYAFPAALCLALCCSCAKSAGTDGVSGMAVELDSLFESLFRPNEPGAVVLVAKGDSVLYTKCLGKARLDSLCDIDEGTRFNICSLAKQVSVAALLRLQEQGLLSLDDTVARFFPEFHSPALNKVTLRQMMSQSSGIPDLRPRTEEQWIEYRRHHTSIYANLNDYMRFSLCDESVRYLTDLDTLNFEPGSAYEYQSVPFQLVLPIVERVTGRRFITWVSENLFEPAGMTHTTYFRPEKKLTHYAHGYRLAEGPNKFNYFRSPDGRWEECDYGEANFFSTKGDSGIYATALDFFHWQRALFTGKIISKESLAQVTTPYVKTHHPYVSYGLGVFIKEEPGKSRVIYASGYNGGFFTFERYIEDSDIFYLVFANRFDWDRYDVAAKMEKLFEKYKI